MCQRKWPWVDVFRSKKYKSNTNYNSHLNFIPNECIHLYDDIVIYIYICICYSYENHQTILRRKFKTETYLKIEFDFLTIQQHLKFILVNSNRQWNEQINKRIVVIIFVNKRRKKKLKKYTRIRRQKK